MSLDTESAPMNLDRGSVRYPYAAMVFALGGRRRLFPRKPRWASFYAPADAQVALMFYVLLCLRTSCDGFCCSALPERDPRFDGSSDLLLRSCVA